MATRNSTGSVASSGSRAHGDCGSSNERCLIGQLGDFSLDGDVDSEDLACGLRAGRVQAFRYRKPAVARPGRRR